MGISTSIFFIAIGAILDFAVKVKTTGVDLHTVGVILMIVGAVGIFVSLLFWNSWGGFGSARHTTVVDRDYGASDFGAGRRVIERDETIR